MAKNKKLKPTKEGRSSIGETGPLGHMEEELSPVHQFSRDFSELHVKWKSRECNTAQLIRDFKTIAQKYQNSTKKISYRGRWPEKNRYIKNGPKWLREKFRRYPWTLPILCEIHESHMSLFNSRQVKVNERDQWELECMHKKAICYAFVDSDREAMARSIGCKSSRLKKYLSAFVKTGFLVELNRGRAGRYYAYGYWAPYFDKNSGKEQTRINKFLNGKTVRNFKNFNVKR